jgi:N-acetylneuraminate synthase
MKSRHVYVIAEAGVNHNGSVDRALQLVDAAALAGADAVKFQTFKAEAEISRHAAKAQYQVATTGSEESQLEMVRKLELDEAAHRLLVKRCAERSIQFLSSPFDLGSVDFLVKELDLPVIKIPSGEITNAPLLLRVARHGKPAILSTGMSDLGDIEKALGVLAFGYIDAGTAPSMDAFDEASRSPEGRAALEKNVTLLHCTTEYPAPLEDVNLNVMATLRAAFGLPVGYSDHTKGIVVPVAAASLGAAIIEKHFTLDRTLPGPDHQASLEPGELRAMVEGIRQVEEALGEGIKAASPSEIKNKTIARKSIVAARDIKAGEVLDESSLTTKRPGTGISPMEFWSLVGTVAKRDYAADELI